MDDNILITKQLNPLYPTEYMQLCKMLLTIPNKNIIARAAIMDNPAPDSDASVKSLGIFLQTVKK